MERDSSCGDKIKTLVIHNPTARFAISSSLGRDIKKEKRLNLNFCCFMGARRVEGNIVVFTGYYLLELMNKRGKNVDIH